MNDEAPIRVGDRTDWSRVGAGRDHVCGIRTDGTLHGWRNDFYGSSAPVSRTNSSSATFPCRSALA